MGLANSTSVTRTLERAVHTIGSVEALAAKLAVAVPDLTRWITGIPPPPDTAIYIAALDIVATGK